MEQVPSALRKAIGQQLIDQALERKTTARAKRHSSEPADVASFGAMLENSKASLLLALFVCAQASSLVLMKASLLSLAAPAVTTALHQAAAVAGVLGATAGGLIEESPVVTSYAVQGSSVQAAVAGIQLLTLMTTLRYGSVFMLLCWMAVVPSALAIMLEGPLQKKGVPRRLQLLLALGLAGAALEFASDHHRGLAAAACVLMWTASKGAEYAWRVLRADATGGGRIADPDFQFHCRSVSDAEAAQSTTTLVLMQNLLPAGPCLLLGIVTLEGHELATHEPSVPALTVVLLSLSAYAGAVVLQAALRGDVSPEGWQLLTATAWLVAILLDFLERSHEMGAVPLLSTLLAVGGGLACSLVAWQHATSHGGLSSIALLTTQPVVAPRPAPPTQQQLQQIQQLQQMSQWQPKGRAGDGADEDADKDVERGSPDARRLQQRLGEQQLLSVLHVGGGGMGGGGGSSGEEEQFSKDQ